MKTGISTATLFLREYNEDALKTFNQLGIESTEVFLTTFSEYTKEFGKILLSNKGKIDVNSIHCLNTQFEPQLYAKNERALKDANFLLDSVLNVAQMLNAKYYTFHGVARLKKIQKPENFESIGLMTNKIIESCEKYGIELSYENVHWAYYNRTGFFKNLKQFCPKLKGVLDIKQAFQSGINYVDYLEEMNEDIVTAHISDIDSDGKLCLPFCGKFDFETLFKRLKDVGFNGAILIEGYKDDFNSLDELKKSYEQVKNLAAKIWY